MSETTNPVEDALEEFLEKVVPWLLSAVGTHAQKLIVSGDKPELPFFQKMKTRKQNKGETK